VQGSEAKYPGTRETMHIPRRRGSRQKNQSLPAGRFAKAPPMRLVHWMDRRVPRCRPEHFASTPGISPSTGERMQRNRARTRPDAKDPISLSTFPAESGKPRKAGRVDAAAHKYRLPDAGHREASGSGGDDLRRLAATV